MMHGLAYLSIVFLLMQFINVLLNLILRQRIRTSSVSYNTFLSVLIPARNEEENLGTLLDGLSSNKSERIEVLVFDDESEDGTAQLVEEYSKRDKRIRLIRSDGLPEGWLGKNYGCYRLAQHAKGDYYLFIDADVRLSGNINEDAMNYMRKHRLVLLSIFPIQEQKTLGEKMVVPIMNYILLTLLPLLFVRISPFKSHSAANGQFMLFDAEAYKEIEPHKVFKESAVEDISIARYLKGKKKKIACLTGEKRVQCRMYRSKQEAIKGFSKNIFMFFGNRPVLAVLFWLITTIGFIPVLLVFPEYFWGYVAGIVMVQIIYSIICSQNVVLSSLLFPIQQFYLLVIILRGFVIRLKKDYSWKGRNIYSC